MIVFLHGVPETSALWDGVRAEFDEETVALSLPGFGCERPEGFGATKDDYADWLITELEKFDAPVDLVGHDWGALLTYRIATTRGDLLRSWTADIANGVHPNVQWHQYARTWQTPGEGEAYFKAIHETPIETRPTRVSTSVTTTHSPWPNGPTTRWPRASSISIDRRRPTSSPRGARS